MRFFLSLNVMALCSLLFLMTACVSSPHVVRLSTPQGDFVPDMRDPRGVCVAMQEERGMSNCILKEAKASSKRDECPGGMSVAGCFACIFECR
jgi:hypothetical protein